MASEASTVSIANKGKASVWTEEAKYELLLRIIHQLKQGRPINWAAINMKDRNTKSLTNVWTKMSKDMAALDDLVDGTPTTTPKKGSAKKRQALKEEDDDDEPETPVKKRVRAKPIKKEEDDADSGEF